MSENIVRKAEVLFYDKEKPGMGRAPAGQLILTDRRLAYIKHLWKGLRADIKDYSGNIEEGLKNEGSLVIPLGEVSEARAESTWGTPYLRVRYQTGSGEKACSFIISASSGGTADKLLAVQSGGVLVRKGPVQELAAAIMEMKEKAAAGH